MRITQNKRLAGRKEIGAAGENAVAQYLEKEGFTILVRNYRVHNMGEIDIIAERGNYIICVEVKTRFNPVTPLGLLVTKSQQRSLIKTAKHFCTALKVRDRIVRFDVALVLRTPTGYSIEQYLPNAFFGGGYRH